MSRQLHVAFVAVAFVCLEAAHANQHLMRTIEVTHRGDVKMDVIQEESEEGLQTGTEVSYNGDVTAVQSNVTKDAKPGSKKLKKGAVRNKHLKRKLKKAIGKISKKIKNKWDKKKALPKVQKVIRRIKTFGFKVLRQIKKQISDTRAAVQEGMKDFKQLSAKECGCIKDYKEELKKAKGGHAETEARMNVEKSKRECEITWKCVISRIELMKYRADIDKHASESEKARSKELYEACKRVAQKPSEASCEDRELCQKVTLPCRIRNPRYKFGEERTWADGGSPQCFGYLSQGLLSSNKCHPPSYPLTHIEPTNAVPGVCQWKKGANIKYGVQTALLTGATPKYRLECTNSWGSDLNLLEEEDESNRSVREKRRAVLQSRRADDITSTSTSQLDKTMNDKCVER